MRAPVLSEVAALVFVMLLAVSGVAQEVQAVESGQPKTGSEQAAEGPPEEKAAGRQTVEQQVADVQASATEAVAEEVPEVVAEEAPEAVAEEVPAPAPVVEKVVEAEPVVEEEVIEVVVEEVVEAEPVQPQPDKPQRVEQPKREKAERDKAAKNSALIDLNPYLFSLILGQAGKAALDEGSMSFSSSGGGIGLLYERHLHKRFSVAARFDYLGIKTKIGMKLMEDIADDGINTEAKLDFSIYNFDLQFRAYPLGSRLYLGGVFGYCGVELNAKGEMIFENDVIDVTPSGEFEINRVKEAVEIGYSPAANGLKFGPVVGWRQTFIGSKGPVLEMSLGWLFGTNLDKSFLSQIEKDSDISGMDKDIKDAIDLAEKYWLIGGPRITLSVGWMF